MPAGLPGLMVLPLSPSPFSQQQRQQQQRYGGGGGGGCSGAPVAAQHEGDAADVDGALAVGALAHHDLLATRVLDVHRDWGRIRDVPQPARAHEHATLMSQQEKEGICAPSTDTELGWHV